MPLPPLRAPDRGRLRAWAITLPAVVFLGAALMLANGLQTLSLLALPLRQGAVFRAMNTGIAGCWWGLCVVLARRLHGARVVISGDPLPEREDAIVVANHQQMADIPQLMALARPLHRLGHLKWFVKDPIKWVPGVGWGMLFLGCIFVKRSWTRDKESVQATFGHVVRHRLPLWLISFVEGTRITPSKLKRARQWASGQGLWEPRHVLMPRTKGFAASVQGLREHAAAVYDVTIGYVGGVPTLWQYSLGYAPVVHLHVRRFAMDRLPEDHEALSAWLMERWREKDALLERFYTEGSFTTTG